MNVTQGLNSKVTLYSNFRPLGLYQETILSSYNKLHAVIRFSTILESYNGTTRIGIKQENVLFNVSRNFAEFVKQQICE